LSQDAQTQAPDGSATPATRWWRRPITWFGGVALAALAAYLTNVLVGVLGNVIGSEQGLADQVAPPAPVRVTAMHRLVDPRYPTGFVVPAGDADHTDVLNRVSDTEQYGAWLTESHAVDLSTTAWQVTLEGGLSSEVVVRDIKPVLEEPCGPPLTGTLITNPSAGRAEEIAFVTDLDQPQPQFLELNQLTEETRPFFGGGSVLKLPKGEKNPLIFIARAQSGHCRFHLEITYETDVGRDTMRVYTPGGEPFEVTGPAAFPAYPWVYVGVLQRCDAADGWARVPGESYDESGCIP
jgi:hypothetical protein